MKIGVILISCGSFNPITRMHLCMFDLAKKFLEQNRKKLLKGIISPVHDDYFAKKGTLVKSTIRAEMINLAIDEFNKTNNIANSWLFCDQWESSQERWRRTIELLDHFEKTIDLESLKNSENCDKIELKLLCGGDLVKSMTNPDIWRDDHIQRITKDFGLFVISRSGFDAQRIALEHPIMSKSISNMIFIENNFGLDHSSTKTRASIREGKSAKHLIYDSVHDYIVKNELYTN